MTEARIAAGPPPRLRASELGLPVGVGIGWRAETAWLLEQRASADPSRTLTEVIAESIPTSGPLPPALAALLRRGVQVVPHGVSLSLGSGDPPDRERLARLARVAERLGAVCVSEHLAFVRGGGHETDHLLPIPRTEEALAVVIDNVRRAQDALPVPLVLENIASLFEWPGDTLGVAEMIAAIVERTGVELLLDVANLAADARNFGGDVDAMLDVLPLERVAYVHAAGGAVRDGFHHDTHAHPVGEECLDALGRLVARVGSVPVVLERDAHFASFDALGQELAALDAVIRS